MWHRLIITGGLFAFCFWAMTWPEDTQIKVAVAICLSDWAWRVMDRIWKVD